MLSAAQSIFEFPSPDKDLEAFGFKISEGGAHTSRTIMLKEIIRLLASADTRAGTEDYRRLVLSDNVLGKKVQERVSYPVCYVVPQASTIFRRLASEFRHHLKLACARKEAALEKCLAVLKDLCQKIICVPEPWMPKAMKIAVIMFAATSSIVCAEVFSWLTAQGIDPKLFLRLLQTTGSRESAARVEEFLKRGKSYGGALSNSYKDIRQALETAAAFELPLPLMNTVNQLQEMARAQGLTRLNTPAAIGKLYEILTATDLSEATLESERVFPEAQEPQVIYLGKYEGF